MLSSNRILHEYVICSKGITYAVYSNNLVQKDKTPNNETALNVNNNQANNQKAIILLLHGLNGGTHQLENMFKTLINNGYQFISIDFYGHGNSSLFGNPSKYTEKLYTEQIYDVLKIKGLLNEKFTVIAFSMGCIIATHLSKDNKISIGKYCLISAAGMAKPRYRFLVFLLKYNIRLCLKLAKRYSRSVISEDTVKKEYYNFENNLDEATKRYEILKQNHEKFMETFLKVLIGIKLQNSKKHYFSLFKTNADILFIYGKNDTLTPYIYTQKFLEQKKEYSKNVKMIIIPECCHLVIHEKFHELDHHLIYFLK
ncbi:alpha/beta hydrolase, putative [Plasmodium berghei]|uniref:Alpha/beta hydrolase, putative n=2 Tax=Plasmodium berghei TaxID=5821 RepID=A0A509AJV7_PLABA|nr:alpha/beta hydrolase, putative [Plasmodium berghei ANKA]CXI55627.1 alpha/beta hydrolase, putative [Plasmodium berghei]SCL95212.1 alpha/beta hydrolase, putative [Plasmodium berghei]SCM16199.1 alpha/beta hydrolase, putative [Plasmodium berghei]SCM17995.1 alpha/beta hydrolase, putative [Plasmodium berghei]SCN26398.1 alpha/beta hydrolase, putative [Plasmodium berghei]|eukprot:XP_034422123.1 alpha/beta hydrolase, putative [Plasmodium berghei ANKA]